MLIILAFTLLGMGLPLCDAMLRRTWWLCCPLAAAFGFTMGLLFSLMLGHWDAVILHCNWLVCHR